MCWCWACQSLDLEMPSAAARRMIGINGNHLDVGVGAGFLDRCRFPTATPRARDGFKLMRCNSRRGASSGPRPMCAMS
jgi:hypothetical protein